MMRKILLLALCSATLLSGCSQESSDGLHVTGITVEHLQNPLGIDVPNPRFSWVVEASYNGAKQTGYELRVSTGPDNSGDVWTMAKASSADSFDVEYAGPALESMHRYYVSIRVNDEHRVSDWSAPQWFETAFLPGTDFPGEWIGRDRERQLEEKPEVLLRQTWSLPEKPIVSARLYVAGLGLHLAYVNGQRASTTELNPAYTPFDRRQLYLTYDVTGLMTAGDNAVGVSLGRGFYSDFNNVDTNVAPWLSEPKLKLYLLVRFDDGSSSELLSSTDWKVADGPTLFNSVKYGEVYDARRELTGWTAAEYDDHAWKQAVLAEPPKGELSAQMHEPITVQQTLPAPVVTDIAEDSQLYDFRTVVAGWATVTVRGQAGSEIRIKYGEKLTPSGEVNSGNDGPFGGTPVQVYRYILKGDPDGESFTPSYSYSGYRFVQIDAPEGVEVTGVTGLVLNNDVSLNSSFSSSSKLLNRYHRAMLQSLRSNMHHIPTDTPMYEKRGWAADALLMVDSALINYGSDMFWEKWMRDHRDNQAADGGFAVIVPNQNPGGPQEDPFVGLTGDPVWSSSFVLVNYALYQHRGNLRVLLDNYPAMARWMGKWMSELESSGFVFDGRTWGDHEPAYGSGMNNRLVGTAYIIRSARAMVEIAKALDHNADAERYEQFVQTVGGALNDAWFDAGKVAYDSPYVAPSFAPPPGLELPEGAEPPPAEFLAMMNTPPEVMNARQFQTDNVLPLALDLVPRDFRTELCRNLVADVALTHDLHLTTGATVLKDAMPVLSDCGAAEVAYRAAISPTFPGWGYWFEGLHGTQGAGGEEIIVDTFWEAWGDRARSHNHAFRGTVDDWLFQYLVGIKPTEPGYRSIQIKPYPVGALTFANAAFDTPLGKVAAAWERDPIGFNLTVTIPVGATAEIYVPHEVTTVPETGVTPLGSEGDYTRFEVGAGTYRFEAKIVAQQESMELSNLKSYWHDDRIDYFETATAMGQDAAINAFGYRFSSDEGRVLTGDAQEAVPLKLFWSEALLDNASIASPQSIAEALANGYVNMATEGYLHVYQRPGTVPVKLFYHPELKDYRTVVSVDSENAAVTAGYEFVRIEGYAFPNNNETN